MRKLLCSVLPLFNTDQISQINKAIKENLIKAEDGPSNNAIKTSQVTHIRLQSIQRLMIPLIDFVFSVNNNHYGFDLFPLTASKILNSV